MERRYESMVYVTLSLVDSLQASTFMRPCNHLQRRNEGDGESSALEDGTL